MIKTAIITCAREEGDAQNMKESIRNSCSLTEDEYKLIEIVGAKSIGEGYSCGLELAQDCDVLVFTHTDVRMWAGRTLWKQMIVKSLTPGVGFVGVAGSRRLMPHAMWWDSGTIPTSPPWPATSGAVAHMQNGYEYMTAFGPYGEVLVLDGVFLACSWTTIKSLSQMSNSEYGFHFYDIDMTFRAHLKGLTNYTVPLPLFHGSVGEIGEEWKHSRRLFLERYGARLPLTIPS